MTQNCTMRCKTARQEPCRKVCHGKVTIQNTESEQGGFTMIGNFEERCRELGKYILSQNCTVRQVAQAKGLSKSTVHKDLTERLPTYDPKLYQEVRQHLKKNGAERHIRGGEATRRKYQRLRPQE